MKHIKFILKLSTLASGFLTSTPTYSSSIDVSVETTVNPSHDSEYYPGVPN